MVVWLIGLSGAGKTTVGRALLARWRQTAPNTVMVDGDAVRALFASVGQEASHGMEGRRTNAERTIALCEWLDSQGMNVICCQLSIFEELRQAHRQRVSGYCEVWLNIPLTVAVDRDTKRIYARALAGEMQEVVGVDIPFPTPQRPDLVLDSSGQAGSPDQLAGQILRHLRINHD